MRRKFLIIFFSLGVIGIATALLVASDQMGSEADQPGASVTNQSDLKIEANSARMIAAGGKLFVLIPSATKPSRATRSDFTRQLRAPLWAESVPALLPQPRWLWG